MSLLFIRGRIFTAEHGDDSLAEAMLVDVNGKVRYVGDERTARSCTFDVAKTTDLGGRVVIPGVIDAHCHLGMLGASLLKPNLVHCNTLKEIQDVLAQHRKKNPSAERLLSLGWRFDALVDADGKLHAPHKRFLDDMFPGLPVYLDAMDLHSVWCSSAALAELNIDETVQDPTGGRFERDSEGKLTGLLVESAAVEKVWPFVTNKASFDERQMALEAAFSSYLSNGVTGCIDMAMSHTDLAALEHYYGSHGNKLPLRVAAHWLVTCVGTVEERLARVHEAIRHRDRLASLAPYLRIVGIKIISDGTIDACTAYIKEAYADGSRAQPMWSRGELVPVLVEADKAGLQIAIHAIGDAAVAMSLDALEQAFEQNGPRPDRRHRLEHMELISPEDVHRLARLQVTASLQPVHADPLIAPNWHAMLNYDERTRRAFAWDEFRNAGCRIALGTDAPTAPYEFLPNMYVATTRRSALDPDMPWPPKVSQLAKFEHTVFGLKDAIIGATKGAAHSCHSEAEVGTLSPGTSADFAILSIDPFENGVQTMARAKDGVQETWVAGKQVFVRH